MKFPKFTRPSQSFKRDERGNIAIMAAISAGVLVAALAISVDMMGGINNKSRLADASDAVSLMLAKSELQTEAEMTAAARDYLDTIYPNSAGQNLSILSIVRDGDSVTVNLKDSVDTAFAGAIGTDEIKTSVSSTATVSRSSMDIALVLDSTGSMRGSKMTTLKSAASDMIETIESLNNPNVRMSVVPFANYVNVGASQRGESWIAGASPNWNGCVGSRLIPNNTRVSFNGRGIPALDDTQARCGTELLPLTNDFNAVNSTVQSLDATGWTYMPSGLVWGWRTLDSGAPLSHRAPANVQKVLVVMTDGANTRAKNGVMHDSASENAKADQTTRDLCDEIKDDNIIVYSIAYEVNNVTTRQLLQGCASAQANYYDARNASDLNEAFADIANSLKELRISA